MTTPTGLTFDRRTSTAPDHPRLTSVALGWALQMWPDGKDREPPIRLHRHTKGCLIAIFMNPDEARAIAAELLHAADVAESLEEGCEA